MDKKETPFNLQFGILHDKARNDEVALRIEKRNKFNKSASNTVPQIENLNQLRLSVTAARHPPFRVAKRTTAQSATEVP